MFTNRTKRKEEEEGEKINANEIENKILQTAVWQILKLQYNILIINFFNEKHGKTFSKICIRKFGSFKVVMNLATAIAI